MASTESGYQLCLDVAAYRQMQADLEDRCHGKWVVFHGGKHIKTSENFEVCALWAMDTYGDAPFLIKRVGLEVLPPPHPEASVRRRARP